MRFYKTIIKNSLQIQEAKRTKLGERIGIWEIDCRIGNEKILRVRAFRGGFRIDVLLISRTIINSTSIIFKGMVVIGHDFGLGKLKYILDTFRQNLTKKNLNRFINKAGT